VETIYFPIYSGFVCFGMAVRKVWGFSALWPLLGGDCGSRIGRVGSMSSRATQSEIEGEIQRACSTMMQDLHNLCAEKKIDIRLKVVQAAGRDVTASEAKKLGATWVVLDRQYLCSHVFFGFMA
jgi:hypothetical protein